MCLNFQLDQSPHKGGGIFAPPPGPGLESQTPVQIGLKQVYLEKTFFCKYLFRHFYYFYVWLLNVSKRLWTVKLLFHILIHSPSLSSPSPLLPPVLRVNSSLRITQDLLHLHEPLPGLCLPPVVLHISQWQGRVE